MIAEFEGSSRQRLASSCRRDFFAIRGAGFAGAFATSCAAGFAASAAAGFCPCPQADAAIARPIIRTMRFMVPIPFKNPQRREAYS